MKELRAEIEINASHERVWQILTDFAAFPQWNPFIRRISGEIRPGAQLQVSIQPTGEKGMLFRPIVLKVEPKRELRWLGRLFMPGIFDGEHIFIIEPLATNRVRFVQRELFRGVLVPFFGFNGTQRGFQEMNEALRKRAEA